MAVSHTCGVGVGVLCHLEVGSQPKEGRELQNMRFLAASRDPEVCFSRAWAAHEDLWTAFVFEVVVHPFITEKSVAVDDPDVAAAVVATGLFQVILHRVAGDGFPSRQCISGMQLAICPQLSFKVDISGDCARPSGVGVVPVYCCGGLPGWSALKTLLSS